MVEESEVVMTTLNGLPKEWDSFNRGICARIKITKLNKLGKNVYKKREQ